MPYDQVGREIDYLRISLIDRCNLRCVYCMPLDGVDFLRSSSLLTVDEIETIARAAVEVGFKKIRLTGGEPTMRPDLISIVARLAVIPGLNDLALTTNGILLPRLAPALAAAGLRRVNIHVDTLRQQRLARVMRFGTLAEIWAGIDAAESAGLCPIKLNTVVTRGFNDEDVVDLAALTLEREWHVRFIELMPLGTGEPSIVAKRALVPSAETRARIEAALGALDPMPAVDRSDECRNFRLAKGRGTVGFISPVSNPYCGSCSRMRLTPDGKLQLCLLNEDEVDVRAALLNGGANAVKAVLLRAVWAKPVGHRLATDQTTERRQMFQLGG